MEPQGAGTFSRSWSRYSEVSAPAPGQTKVVYLTIIRIEQDQKSELSQHSLQKVMKNLLFHLKAVKTGTQKA